MSQLPPSGLPLGTEEQFSKDVAEVLPMLERMKETMRGSRNILTGQRFQVEANQLIMNRQNAEISANRDLLNQKQAEADTIVKAAEDRAKVIERGIVERVAIANHKEREATARLEEAERILWQAKEDAKKIAPKSKEKVAA